MTQQLSALRKSQTPLSRRCKSCRCRGSLDVAPWPDLPSLPCYCIDIDSAAYTTACCAIELNANLLWVSIHSRRKGIRKRSPCSRYQRSCRAGVPLKVVSHNKYFCAEADG